MNPLRSFRKGLVLLFLLITVMSQAQTINTTYKTQINAKFAGIDKIKVPNKLLVNQAMEFAELNDYSGSFTTTNFTTQGKYTSIYNTLLMSRVQSGVTGLISPVAFKSNWDNLRQPGKIVLSGLYYKYSKFKTDAYPNYLVNNNNIITDKYVGGIWQNPYIDQQVFAIASPILVYKSLSLQVTLPSSLWYTNDASSIQSIAIDFGNGAGYQTMTLGQFRNINYASSGTYEWKYKLTLTNAQILFSHGKLKIDIPVFPTIPTNPTSSSQTLQPNGTLLASQAIVNPPPPSCANITPIPFIGTRQYLGVANSATLQVRYQNSDCIISKPLIIVEGFDSGLSGVENPFGENDLFKFAQEAFDDTGNLPFEIINKDIIYINFNQGRDDLRRNSYLVEDVIKWVNTKKAQAGSTTPNVVLGQSMGGVIARYALRDMELQQALNPSDPSWQHKTNLYVSHDAPQLGANIPLGVQYFARHLANQFIDTPLGDYQISVGDGSNISISDIQNLFESQGTKQLLSNYIDSGFGLNNIAFDTFQTELRTLGYPTQTRNIAISNGNHCANPQDFNPSATLFALNGNAGTGPLTTLLTVLIEPLTGVTSAPLAYEFNEPGLLLGMLPGSSNFAMNFNANALPTAGTSNQIYHGSITYTKKIFSLFGWDPKITVSLTNRSYNNPVYLSYDYYPGGKYNLPFNFDVTPIHSAWVTLGIYSYLAPSFDFIPVPSALDIGSGTTVLNNSDYLRKYSAVTPPVAPKNSPFVNFTTSFPNNANLNEEHISFNTRNGNWLASELDNNANNNDYFDCTYICSDAQITGSNVLCTSATYSAPSVTLAYNWTITSGSNLATLSGNGMQTVTLTAIGNQSGNVTLSLTLGDANKCGSTATMTKNIWVGKPSIDIALTSTTNYANIDLVSASTTPIQSQGITSTTWTEIASTDGGSAGGSGFSGFGNGPNFYWTATVKITATNLCGTTEITKIITCAPPYPCDPTYRLDPTTNGYLARNIIPCDQNGNRNPTEILVPDNEIITAQMFDVYGAFKLSYSTNNFYTNTLPSGMYILKVQLTKALLTKKIIIP